MKKKAFTLAEILIAFGAIGIIAAVTAPMLGSLMPDENKMKVLKNYKILNETTKALLNDPMYYYDYIVGTVSVISIKRQGLAANDDLDGNRFVGLRNDMNISEYRTKYHGSQKYCYLLYEKMETTGDIAKEGSNAYVFELVDGSKYYCKPKSAISFLEGNVLVNLKQEYEITIDTNGDDGPNAIATKDLKKPDRFIFKVDNFGKITGVDPLTIQYLKNPNKLNDKKADYKAAFPE